VTPQERTRPAGAPDATTGRAATMRAIVQDRYGEVDVLRLAEIPRPEIGDDEVLVRVAAAGVERGVWHLMTGLAYPIRVAGFGVRKPKNRVRGREVAGWVDTVGRAVTAFQPGDEVYGIGEGTFAEYARAAAAKLAPKPSTLSFEEAAVVPISATTALQGLRGRVRPGQRVLVIGASGGVGTFAVQLAKAFGAEVTGVASTSKVDLVRSLGADHVVDYRRDDFADGRQRYDLVLDTGGHRRLADLRRALTPRGTLVIVGSETGGRWLGGLDRVLRALVLSRFVGQQLGGLLTKENAEDLRVLTSRPVRRDAPRPADVRARPRRPGRRAFLSDGWGTMPP
jgi:NADPH:quinone reductase-like Zn-dependent oxidoreductase